MLQYKFIIYFMDLKSERPYVICIKKMNVTTKKTSNFLIDRQYDINRQYDTFILRWSVSKE